MLLLLLLLPALASPRLLHSLPPDTHAFPKFHVAFLNSRPVLNDTAQRWLAQGLRGGHPEFLDLPSQDESWLTPSARKDIGSPDRSTANYTLELLKIGPHDSYICLIPSPPQVDPAAADDRSTTDISPARSWSLLQPLTGSCLYHRQGWFTYSYCHNNEIRQFRELNYAGATKPEEDPEFESYILGKAPSKSESGVDLTVTEQNANAVNLELARSAGSRYLVQRWGDGTVCDKTKKSREVEVQFHCSMTMTDTILFVKEAKTCSYVLVIHTPRLCGEPGFKSRLDSNDEAQIHCREIVSGTLPESEATTSADASATSAFDANVGQAGSPLSVADYPFKMVRTKAVQPPSVTKQESESQKDKVYQELLRKTLEALFGENAVLATGKLHNVQDILGNDGSRGMVIELDENAEETEGYDIVEEESEAQEQENSHDEL
ncbi:hypothetical protein APHAL10511_001247 [Amanita phalloides]|nr:hypothetical protein APHAL10511_001247 [Amanita phalloides]